jgi:heat-inducible transcriptional repressor
VLTERQAQILRIVVETYLDSGEPVGSKAIAGLDEVEWSASTVRAELAALEAAGFLTHPHTSAGRVPTDAGYRYYVDALLATGPKLPAPKGSGLDLSRIRREVDEVMRETTSTL